MQGGPWAPPPCSYTPLRLCLISAWFLFGSFGIYVWSVCEVFLVSGVEMLFGLVPFKTCPFFGLLFVCPFFFSLVVGMFVDDVFLFLCLSLSLSLSGAGEPQTPAGFVFPLVSLRPGRGLRLRPVPLHFLLHQGLAPHLFFFFFSVARLPSRCFSRSLSWFWLVSPGVGLGRSVLFALACMH